MSSLQDEGEFSGSFELESELADVFNRFVSRKNKNEQHILGRRNTIAVTTRKQSIDEYNNGFERQREKPAQSKLEKEIEVAQQRANELRMIQSVRQLTALEINELKQAELDEFEARRKLKRTKDAAIRAKRYRIKKAAHNELYNSQPEHLYISPGQSQSPEDHRALSSNSFTDPLTNAASYISKLTKPNSPISRKRTHSPGNSNFQCSQCDAKFSVFGSFVTHMRSQHLKNDEWINCKFCKATFPNEQAKSQHVLEHFISTNSSFSCQDCGKTFDTGAQYRQHHTTFHTDIIHRCGICLQLFTQSLSYQEHIMTHVMQETKYFCIACNNLAFDTLELLESHVSIIHDNNNADINGLNKQQNKKIKINNHYSSSSGTTNNNGHNNKGLKCYVCDQECSSENALDEHKLLNHCKIPKGNQCAVCKNNLSSLQDYIDHMQQHSDDFNDMSCIICRQTIRNEQQLKLHGEYHLDIINNTTDIIINMNKCTTCNEMISENEMARHYLNHGSDNNDYSNDNKNIDNNNDDIPVIDDDSSSNQSNSNQQSLLTCHCGQQFDDQNELTAHALEHLNEALPGYSEQSCATTVPTTSSLLTFDCPKCPKRFNSLSALQGHSHVHMNTKMFKCDQCNQTFSTSSRLQQHKAKHLNKSDLKCRICDKRFPTCNCNMSRITISRKGGKKLIHDGYLYNKEREYGDYLTWRCVYKEGINKCLARAKSEGVGDSLSIVVTNEHNHEPNHLEAEAEVKKTEFYHSVRNMNGSPRDCVSNFVNTIDSSLKCYLPKMESLYRNVKTIRSETSILINNLVSDREEDIQEDSLEIISEDS